MGRDVREIKYLEKLMKNEKNLKIKDRIRAILLMKKKYNR
jgi:hypothetical protein